MHIGFITSEFPHENYQGSVGGIGTFMRNLSFHLIKKQHNVSVFLYNQKEDNTYQYKNMVVYHIKRKVIKGFGWYTNRKYVQNKVNEICLTENVDVLESYEWTGFTAFMKFKKPLLLRLHGSDTYFCHLENRRVKRINKFFEKRALLNADYIIGVSDFVSDKTKELFNLKKEIRTIHNGIDTNSFYPDHSQTKEKTILYFGTIVRKKGVIALSKMFNKLVELDSSVHLTFLGRNNIDVLTNISTLELCLQEMSKEAQSKFEYISSVPYEEVQSYIKKSDVIALPSFAEAFPMTWLESMSLEKKLITSNIGWAKEMMIDGETGFTIDPNDVDEFAKKTLDLLNDSNNSYGMKARKRILKNFDNTIIVQKNIDLYNLIIKSN